MSTTVAIMSHETAEKFGISDVIGLQRWYKENSDSEKWDPDWVVDLTEVSCDRFLGTLSKGEIFNLEIINCYANLFHTDWSSYGTISGVVSSDMGRVGESIREE